MDFKITLGQVLHEKVFPDVKRVSVCPYGEYCSVQVG